MWTSESVPLESQRGLKVRLFRGEEVPSFAQVCRLWRDDEAFRTFFFEQLANAPFSAYLWETPPVTSTSFMRSFEFVLIDSPALASMPIDADSFSSYFSSPEAASGVVTFPNLGNDAVLVVPCPLSGLAAYPHLAAFTREAPEAQQHAFWQAVGAAMEARVGAAPTWLSTCGLGVAWLHVRLDSIPKYYHHRPYREDRG